jgi:hypothetical protein
MVDKYSRYGNNFSKKSNQKNLTSHEEYEIKEAMKKLKQEKNKNISLKKENNELYNEILILKSNIRSHISVHQKSKGNSFPSFETLKNNIIHFLEIDCLNFFKKYLYDEFEIEGVEFFYKEVFKFCENILKNHFMKIEEKLDLKFKDKNVKNTLDCILKNTFQVDWKRLMNNLIKEEKYGEIMKNIQNTLEINEKNERVNTDIIIFIKKAMEIIFQCYIHQPKISFDLNKIGVIVYFNEIKYEQFFGDIKRGEKCRIILPSFTFYNEGKRIEEFINKEKVMKQEFFSEN